MRPGKIVHVNGTIAAADIRTHRINIPRRRNVRANVPQDLFGPNWQGGPVINPHRAKSPVVGGSNVSRISIRNKSATAVDLEVSFDGGENFFTLTQDETFTWEVNHNYFFIRNETAAHAEVTMECIAVVS